MGVTSGQFVCRMPLSVLSRPIEDRDVSLLLKIKDARRNKPATGNTLPSRRRTLSLTFPTILSMEWWRCLMDHGCMGVVMASGCKAWKSLLPGRPLRNVLASGVK